MSFKLVIFTIMLSLFSVVSSAELGGTVASVEKDRQAFKASMKVLVNHSSYSVQEMVYGNTKVREFYSADGKVFAVAWNGMTHPDPTQILGTYYTQFKNAESRQPESVRPRGSRNYSVESANMVLEKGGHMSNVVGRAYDPQLLPENFSLDDLK